MRNSKMMKDHITIDNIKITKEDFLWLLDNKDSINRTSIYKIVEIIGFSNLNMNLYSSNNQIRIEYFVNRLYEEEDVKYYQSMLTIELTPKTIKMLLIKIRNETISNILK